MIRKFLDLSTGHISRATLDRLNAADHPDALPFSGGITSFGWFAYCHDENTGVGDDEIPADLWAIMVYARSIGCEYVMLDADGPEIEALPTFDHDAGEPAPVGPIGTWEGAKVENGALIATAILDKPEVIAVLLPRASE